MENVVISAEVKRVPKWLLPTLSEVVTLNDPTWAKRSPQSSESGRSRSRIAQQVRAEREWSGAIAALDTLLQERLLQNRFKTEALSPQGLVISGPLPVLSHSVVPQLSSWTLTASVNATAWMPFQLLPATEVPIAIESTPPTLSLLPGDPLAAEQFCLVQTPWFSLVMVLGESLTEEPAFMFSFMPEVVEQAWRVIRPRILLMHSQSLDWLDDRVSEFAPIAPDYQTVMEFSRLLLENLPDEERPVKQSPIASEPVAPEIQAADVELLQAIAHEVRTPLTTIRTLTRSLLKRQELSPDVIKRLQMIDRECNEQIDRFGLIFHAVELETDTRQTTRSLTRTPLEQVLQQSIPRWQQQANQRHLTLDVTLPQKMPAVVSDPSMLDKALTSLIERFTRSLPAGSHIQVEATLAGDQLKLQLQSQPESSDPTMPHPIAAHPLKSIGHLLMFQPETGCLSLNLSATKNLFQALGGKLTVKQRPEQGEIMTVFLPLG